MVKHGARRALRRAQEGGTAIEYAMIAPVLLLLIMGIAEYDLIMFAMTVLEGATTAAARAGATGYVNTGSTGNCPSPVVNGTIQPQSQAQYINCIVGLRVSGLLNPANLQVTYNDTNSSTFNAATDAPTVPTGPCTNNPALVNPPTLPMCAENNQTAGDIVVYTVTYPWPIATPILQNFLGTNGTFTLVSSAVVKNEPYNVGAR